MSRAGRVPPPLDLLAGVLPGADQTDFLLACLAPGPQAVAAWRRWRARHVPTEWLAGLNKGMRRLSALLASSLLAAGAPLDDRDAAWLRAALLYEERRSRTFRAILGEVVPARLFGGAGCGWRVVPNRFDNVFTEHHRDSMHNEPGITDPWRLHYQACIPHTAS